MIDQLWRCCDRVEIGVIKRRHVKDETLQAYSGLDDSFTSVISKATTCRSLLSRAGKLSQYGINEKERASREDRTICIWYANCFLSGSGYGLKWIDS